MKKEALPVGVEEARILYGAAGAAGAAGGEEAGLSSGTAGLSAGAAGAAGAGSWNRADPLRRAVSAGPPGRGLRRLSRVLAGIVCGLVLVILGGTLYAVFRDSRGPGPEEAGISAGPESAVFTGIGRLRIAAGAASSAASSAASGADSASRAVVVLSVVFPYPPGDRPFTEELAGKVPLFRRIIRDYFGALSGDELKPLDERRAKGELLRRFNAELQLGKIELLLFNELMILE